MHGLAASTSGEEKVPRGPRREGVVERRQLSESAPQSTEGNLLEGGPLLSFLFPTLPRRKANHPATQWFWSH